ncbi:unnamed protein product [Cuscuta epithymum]|uniref:Cytochrome P450 n=1 Tax=Cuscuta epithymum TaxID=186058 RepID=A0AAV0GL61_9ASTE|nr:unnamed protein product [Cuscuta epithymum]
MMGSLSSVTSLISPYSNLFLTCLPFLVSGLILLLSRKSKFKNGKRPNLPPGPPGWPVVGNLFQVARSGKTFLQYVRDLKPEYGPIFTLRMGTRTMVIITSADLAHEALIQKGQIFANRPAETPTRSIFSSNKFSVNASVYGPVWRSLRKNMVQNMLSSARFKEFRDARVAAMDRLIDRIGSEAESNGGAVWVLANARFAVFCILLAMCFGIEMDESTIDEVDRTMKAVLIVLAPRVDDFLPILSPFFSKQRKRVLEVRKHQLDTIVPLIEKRRRALENHDKTAATFSYLDTLFDFHADGKKSAPTNAELVTLVSEFLNGGTDTTATAVEWAVARLIENPSLQSKLYQEIKNQVGNRKVDEKDIEKMPYLNAVVKEVLRKHPPTFFALTHAVTEPTQLGGYDIPVDCNVEFFLPAISEDPKIWSDPEKFDPDRFVSGEEDADITGVTGVKMMPFGVGRRICPGLGMATVHVNLMLARMVQEFEWSVYPENTKVDLSDKFEFTVVLKNPLRAQVKPRECKPC